MWASIGKKSEISLRNTSGPTYVIEQKALLLAGGIAFFANDSVMHLKQAIQKAWSMRRRLLMIWILRGYCFGDHAFALDQTTHS